MTVVPAGVAAAFDRALPGVFALVGHREGIAVRAQRHCGAGAASFNQNEHAALDGRLVNIFDAPAAQRLGDLSAGARRFEAELRVRMQIVPKGFEFRLPADDFREALVLENNVRH